MTSFLVRNCSIFDRSFCSLSISDCCCASSSATCWSSDCSSVWANCLRSSAVRARSSLPAGERLARLRVELDDLLLELLLLELKALLRGDDVGDALLDVLQQLHLLLVAVLERLGRVLGLVEQLRDLRLDDGGEPPGQPGHRHPPWGSFEGQVGQAYRARPASRRRQARTRRGGASMKPARSRCDRAPERAGRARRLRCASAGPDSPGPLVSSRRPAIIA